MKKNLSATPLDLLPLPSPKSMPSNTLYRDFLAQMIDDLETRHEDLANHNRQMTAAIGALEGQEHELLLLESLAKLEKEKSEREAGKRRAARRALEDRLALEENRREMEKIHLELARQKRRRIERDIRIDREKEEQVEHREDSISDAGPPNRKRKATTPTPSESDNGRTEGSLSDDEPDNNFSLQISEALFKIFADPPPQLSQCVASLKRGADRLEELVEQVAGVRKELRLTREWREMHARVREMEAEDGIADGQDVSDEVKME